MMKTIVGLYDNMSNARDVVQDLVDSGFDRDNINLVAGDPEGRYGAMLDRDVDVDTDETTTGEAAIEGAVAGGAIGGLAGVLLGLGAFAIPGLGPVIAVGPIVAGLIGAGVGAASGGLLGALVDWGLSEEEAGYYAEGVRRGGILVAVKAPDNQVDRIVSIMNQHDPVDIEQRATEWRQGGWTGYDVNAGPYIATGTDRDYYRAPDYEGNQDFEVYRPDFHRHYELNYADSDYDYNSYEPAYRYGYILATDERFRDRDWNEIEPEVRRRWEETNEGTWDEFEDAIEHGWNKVKNALS